MLQMKIFVKSINRGAKLFREGGGEVDSNW